MPATAFQHFQEDIARARAIIDHADSLPTRNTGEQMLRSDLLRSGWMFSVGALDAYFCDAYTDLVAATIISKNRVSTMTLPDFFYEIRFPVRAILEPYAANVNWRWRMAARKMMERENILRLDTIQTLFNKFFRRGHKLFRDVIEDWIKHPQARKRRFAITPTAYDGLNLVEKDQARKEAKNQMFERYGMILQRRHDCIHNCDRPKMSPQLLDRRGTVLKVIEDVEFLVTRCNGHIDTEFRHFLIGCGCSTTIVTQAGY